MNETTNDSITVYDSAKICLSFSMLPHLLYYKGFVYSSPTICIFLLRLFVYSCSDYLHIHATHIGIFYSDYLYVSSSTRV